MGATECGLGPGWDTSLPKSYPAKSPAADRLRRTGSASLVHRLQQPYAERFAETLKQRQKQQASYNPNARLAPPPQTAKETFEGFLSALSSQESLAKLKPEGSPVMEGSMNHMKEI